MPRSIRYTDRFRYEDPGAGNPPPIVAARISIKDGPEVSVPLLVDSGADGLLLPLAVARALRLDLGSMEEIRVSGVAGMGLAYKSPARLLVNISRLFCYCNALFVSSDSLPDHGLLGREDWFRNFEVAFRHKLREILMVDAS